MGKSKKQKSLLRKYPDISEIKPLPSVVADGHTHIDLGNSDFTDNVLDINEILDSCKSVGIGKIVQASTDLESSKYSSELASKNSEIIAMVGIHPNSTPELVKNNLLDEHLQKIEELIKSNPKIRGIGETGLDFFRTSGEVEQNAQRHAFIKHIELAKRTTDVMQIHIRDAYPDAIKILNEHSAPKKTVFHCFSGDEKIADYVAQNGYFASFAGNITYNANNELRAALKRIPLNRILVETDAPFLSPVPFRGRPNISYLTAVTVRYIADFLEIDLKEFCEQLLNNFFEVFGKW